MRNLFFGAILLVIIILSPRVLENDPGLLIGTAVGAVFAVTTVFILYTFGIGRVCVGVITLGALSFAFLSAYPGLPIGVQKAMSFITLTSAMTIAVTFAFIFLGIGPPFLKK